MPEGADSAYLTFGSWASILKTNWLNKARVRQTETRPLSVRCQELISKLGCVKSEDISLPVECVFLAQVLPWLGVNFYWCWPYQPGFMAASKIRYGHCLYTYVSLCCDYWSRFVRRFTNPVGFIPVLLFCKRCCFRI